MRGLAHSYTARRLLAASKLTLSHTGERVLLSVAAVGLCLCHACCLHLANTALSRQLRLLGQLGADGAGSLGIACKHGFRPPYNNTSRILLDIYNVSIKLQLRAP